MKSRPDEPVEACEGLDQIAPFNSVTRLEERIAETRIHHCGRS